MSHDQLTKKVFDGELKNELHFNASITKHMKTSLVTLPYHTFSRRTQQNIGIKHGFSCINIRQVPKEVLKTEAESRGFQHLLRDLANVNTLKKTCSIPIIA